MAKRAKVFRARELRKESTRAEQSLWQYLRDRRLLGKKFRRQHVFWGFILDFYCPDRKLGIELDGSVHQKKKDYDILRQEIMENEGIKIIRFSNREILSDIKEVLVIIAKHLTSPSPLENGEGR